jgi:hypothetical protein
LLNWPATMRKKAIERKTLSKKMMKKKVEMVINHAKWLVWRNIDSEQRKEKAIVVKWEKRKRDLGVQKEVRK